MRVRVCVRACACACVRKCVRVRISMLRASMRVYVCLCHPVSTKYTNNIHYCNVELPEFARPYLWRVI